MGEVSVEEGKRRAEDLRQRMVGGEGALSELLVRLTPAGDTSATCCDFNGKGKLAAKLLV